MRRWLFFFQAEDGIRDGHVTGVQTCALPISADGADHRQQQLDALHENGPERLWKETGDHAHLLSEIAQEPRGMFDVEKHDSATYVQLLRTLHEAQIGRAHV